MKVTMSERERLSAWAVLSNAHWGGNEDHILAQLELLETLELEQFDERAVGDVNPKAYDESTKDYDLSDRAIEVLRLILCGLPQSYTLGRYSARALKRMGAVVPDGG